MSIHTGHRARLKARFFEEGLDGFDEHQVLELLLFYAIPQRDTNVIAHNLLKRFGSLSHVIDAPVKELSKVEGMGKNAAVFLSLIKQLERYYHINRNEPVRVLDTLDLCGAYMVPFFNGLTKETVYLLSLDAACKLISCRAVVEEGGINCTNISIRKIVDMALTENATSVVLAHNHPSGVALPSPEDVQATRRIAQALKFVDVTLIDHLVIADGDFVSMTQSNYYNPRLLENY